MFNSAIHSNAFGVALTALNLALGNILIAAILGAVVVITWE